MVSCQSGENSLELVIINRTEQIIGLVLVCKVEMELNFFSTLRLYCHVGLSNTKLLREKGEKKSVTVRAKMRGDKRRVLHFKISIKK